MASTSHTPSSKSSDSDESKHVASAPNAPSSKLDSSDSDESKHASPTPPLDYEESYLDSQCYKSSEESRTSDSSTSDSSDCEESTEVHTASAVSHLFVKPTSSFVKENMLKPFQIPISEYKKDIIQSLTYDELNKLIENSKQQITIVDVQSD